MLIQGMMQRKNFYGRGNDAFTCEQCGAKVEPLKNGSYRNHCPFCLWSKHTDIIPGDRLSECRDLMEPIRIEYSSKKKWMIVHRCVKCGFIRRNKVTLDDEQSDNLQLLCQIAAQQNPA